MAHHIDPFRLIESLQMPSQSEGDERERTIRLRDPSLHVLAACAELKLEHVYRAGGAAAIAAMAFGTATIPKVDKIVGPGNTYVQLAKRALSGAVGIDGFLGPSEIVVLAETNAVPPPG